MVHWRLMAIAPGPQRQTRGSVRERTGNKTISRPMRRPSSGTDGNVKCFRKTPFHTRHARSPSTAARTKCANTRRVTDNGRALWSRRKKARNSVIITPCHSDNVERLMLSATVQAVQTKYIPYNWSHWLPVDLNLFTFLVGWRWRCTGVSKRVHGPSFVRTIRTMSDLFSCKRKLSVREGLLYEWPIQAKIARGFCYRAGSRA